uniref:Uncharacterized protein n=2 Tax=Mesocestoides corti TaxID=53468 RepID=A0A5K3G563_MESCO
MDTSNPLTSSVPASSASAATTAINAPPAGKKSKANNAATRRHLNLGVGGFRARPTRVYQ